MCKDLTESKRRIIRMLKSPVFTEKSIENAMGNLRKSTGSKAILAAQQHTLEGFMKAVRCLLDKGIPTIAEHDELLEELWAVVEDIPMNPESECLENGVLDFPAGTSREEIWHWFDVRHSKGIAYLLHKQQNVKQDEDFKLLLHLNSLCEECDGDLCAYNDNGLCKYPLVHGKPPEWTDHDGCVVAISR